MRVAAEAVGHVIVGGLAADVVVGAALHVLRAHLVAVAVATDLGPDRRTGHHTTRRGDVATTAATDLVTDHAADDGAHERTTDIRCLTLLHLFAFDPATLLGLPHHGADRQHLGLKQGLVLAAAEVASFLAALFTGHLALARVGLNLHRGLGHRLLFVNRVGRGAADQTQRGLDLTLQGPFSLFGRTHEFITGFNYQDYKNDHTGYDVGTTTVNFYDWDNYLPRPTETGALGEILNIKSSQRGTYAAFKFNLMDDLNVIVGARTSDYDYDYYYWPTSFGSPDVKMHERGEVTPYAGIIYDLTPEQSVYASYTDIFKPQSNLDRNGSVIGPVIGSNYEVGWKGAFYDGRLNASTALFLVKRDNLAVEDSGEIVQGTLDQQAYKGAKGTETKGIDLELSGEVLPGWQVMTSYSHARTEDADGVRQLTQYSMDTFRFWNTYRFQGDWNRLTVGGGVSWNSSMSLYYNSLKARATQDDYTVASLMARYQVTDHLAATLNLNNIFDEKYYSGIGGSVGHYGDPRNATMSLRYDF